MQLTVLLGAVYGRTIVNFDVVSKMFCVKEIESVLLPFFPVVRLKLVIDSDVFQ